MELSRIKFILESTYHVGFDVSGDTDYFKIVLADSTYDKFELIGQIKDGIRLNISSKPEKFAGNFLRIINNSGFDKRKNFNAMLGSISKGETLVCINGAKVIPDSFVNDASIWNEFEIKYTLIPFVLEEDAYDIINTICGMMLSLVDYHVEGFAEGNEINIHVDRYERNPINRKICLAAHGYKCCICGFDFEKTYGSVGKNTIEVHHTVPVSEMGDNYIVKPIEELTPVCSNCHTIIHKKTPPYTIDEVKGMLTKTNPTIYRIEKSDELLVAENEIEWNPKK